MLEDLGLPWPYLRLNIQCLSFEEMWSQSSLGLKIKRLVLLPDRLIYMPEVEGKHILHFSCLVVIIS